MTFSLILFLESSSVLLSIGGILYQGRIHHPHYHYQQLVGVVQLWLVLVVVVEVVVGESDLLVQLVVGENHLLEQLVVGESHLLE